jgi:hypothetical protein
MAPASFSTEIAQPRSVRIAGRLSLVISTELAPAGTNPCARRSFRLLTQGWDSGSEELIVFHLFRFDVRRSTGRFSGKKRGSINVPWFPRSGAPVRIERATTGRPACRRRKCAFWQRSRGIRSQGHLAKFGAWRAVGAD